MGLDTRAYAKATPEWKEQWVTRVNEQGWRMGFLGLFRELIGKKNYGRTGGYLGGRPPVTLEDAPDFHQDGLDQLNWPENHPLVGGMVSGNGDGPSFRGKVYDGYVENVTGRSLYQACDDDGWQGEVLLEVTEALLKAVDKPNEYLPEREDRWALAQWFVVCLDNDLVVSGDY